MFADEPTSGLDSFQAQRVRHAQLQGLNHLLRWAVDCCYLDSILAAVAQQMAVCDLQVMQTLKDLASEGKTVVCSIHQPRSSIFEMFDDLLLASVYILHTHVPNNQACAPAIT